MSHAEVWKLPLEPPLGAGQATGWLRGRTCRPSDAVRHHVERQGLRLQDHLQGAALLDEAEIVVELIPSLASVVRGWVGQLHLLDAVAGFDISHSEPQWRSRIFVSTPERTGQVGGLRIAESVIHETMHLQLTGYEAVEPIVADEAMTMPSPWRPVERPLRGVVHGLFVFTCLKAFFEEIDGLVDIEGRIHARTLWAEA